MAREVDPWKCDTPPTHAHNDYNGLHVCKALKYVCGCVQTVNVRGEIHVFPTFTHMCAQQYQVVRCAQRVFWWAGSEGVVLA